MATRVLLFILMASSLELVPWSCQDLGCKKSGKHYEFVTHVQANVVKFDGHIGAVTAISFSDNGYFLATAAQDSVKLWDLRKLKNFKTPTPYDENTPIQSVEFDNSGSYLALGGSDIRIYQVANIKSEWNCNKTFPDLSGTGKATCVKFGPDAKYIAVGSMDRNLRIFGLPEEDGPSELSNIFTANL